MMFKYIKIYLISVTFMVLLVLVSCNEEKVVTITKDYVINPNWDKTGNAFRVVRMKLKDSNDSIKLNNVSPLEFVQKLEKDTSFTYTANVEYNGENYSKRKVYFERDNGFLWWGDVHDSNSSKKVLGQLQQETWYFFGGLGKEKTLYYVYLDCLGSLQVFKVPGSSWTNI